MADDFVKLYTAHDTMEAEIIKDVLSANDIEVFVQGLNHRSLLGHVGAYVELNILVPEGQLKNAEQLLAAFEAEHQQQSAAQTPPSEEVPLHETLSPPHKGRRIPVACMLAFFLPGLGNLYAGRKLLGSWVLMLTGVCYVSLLVVMSTVPDPLVALKYLPISPWRHMTMIAWLAMALIILMLGDAVSAALYLRRK